MSIEIKDIEHLAALSRIELTEEEKTAFQKDLTSILGYVSELTSVVGSNDEILYTQKNIVRDDVITETAYSHTEDILQVAPKRNDNYVEVDQVF